MNKKQRNRNKRIVVALICFAVLMALNITGKLRGLNGYVLFIIYFIPYLIVGCDVIVRAAKNISRSLMKIF